MKMKTDSSFGFECSTSIVSYFALQYFIVRTKKRKREERSLGRLLLRITIRSVAFPKSRKESNHRRCLELDSVF